MEQQRQSAQESSTQENLTDKNNGSALRNFAASMTSVAEERNHLEVFQEDDGDVC